MAISVVVPIYNEENAVKSSIDELRSVLADFGDYEIIAVNDGSTDQSLSIITAIEGKHIKVINHVQNLGYGKSLWDGIREAKYEYIAITDVDGTYPVNDLKKLFEYLPDFDMVIGARRGKEYDKGIIKGPARMIFKFIAEYATGKKNPDINSGFRIFKRDIVLDFEDPLCMGFSFTTTITLLFNFNNYFIKYVPITYLNRIGKSKVHHFKDTLRAGQIIVETFLYYNPLKLFLLLATLNAIFGVILGLFNKVFMDIDFLATAAAMCIASFVPVFGLGLLATQIRRLFWKRKS
jgi:glycosyltransferase involved in cell wall biosynthesis